jgi:YD repeat-containing protein
LFAARRDISGGTLLISTYGWTTIYTYDAGGRLSGRGRHRYNAFSSWLVDTITYTGWDRSNRPIAGELTVPEGDPTVPMPTLITMPLSITYDDAARVMQASNGEFVMRDKDGNIVKEVEFSGDPATDYVVTASATVCQ